MPSTLLWKISGKDLKQPSYLYGTMHLTDERIFNLGDSLYKAIEHSEGFAIEIDPAEFTPMVIMEAKKSIMGAVRLKEMMAPEKFKKYSKLLSKRLNKNADDITTADVLHEKNKWIDESYSSGKMQTFLDIYLFDIARRGGKWIGGVEDAKDQQVLLGMISESDILELALSENNETSKKAEDAFGEYFINAYVRNDLQAIDSLSSLGDTTYQDAVLVKRNKKMAFRMDSLSHVRTMVFAVGAAHLPGDKGLIALLKEKGYTVTPVFSSKKIKPSDYKVAEVPLKWYNVSDDAGLYTASLPGKPGNMTMYGVMNMQVYFDVFSSTVYMTTALSTPYNQAMADSIFGNVADSYFGTSDYKKGKPVTINNVPGREFISTKENYSHGYLLFKDGMMYMAVAMCMKKDNSAAADIDRFLHSFKILAPVANEKKGFIYTNTTKAYQVELPSPFQSAEDMVAAAPDSTLTRELWVASDKASGAYLFFGTNETAPGYSIVNDSTSLVLIGQSQKNKFEKLSIDTMYIKNGVRMLDLKGTMATAPLTLKVHYQFRGNRWYALVAVYDALKNTTSVDRFFDSFRTLDYATDEWSRFESDDSIFSSWAPSKFSNKTKLTSGEGRFFYNAFDSSRGDAYLIVVENFSKYYWKNSDSAFWKDLLQQFDQEDDTLLLKKEILNGGAAGYEIVTQKRGSLNVKRARILLNAGKLYSIVTVQLASEINNANNNKYFDSFRFTNEQSSAALFKSKAAALLDDIGSEDSGTSNTAVKYLSLAQFSKEDLPLIHAALLKNYSTDDEKDNDVIKSQLGKVIKDLKDTSSLSFARDHFIGADDTTRNILLNVLTSFPSAENYIILKNILLNHTPRIKPDYDFQRAFTDSIKLAAEIFPDLLPLLKDTVMAEAIVSISKTLLDSGLISKNLLRSYKQDILKFAQKQYKKIAGDPDDYGYVDFRLETLLGKLNLPETNGMLQKWSVLQAPYIQLNAVSYLLQNRQVINPVAVQSLARDKNTRVELYDTLRVYKKQSLFPTKYLSQKSFAESIIYRQAEDDSPTGIIFVAEKVVNFKGKKSRFFFYKMAFGGDDAKEYYLGCAGPFPFSLADVSLKDAFGQINYEDIFDDKNLPAQKDGLISQMRDGFEWQGPQLSKEGEK